LDALRLAELQNYFGNDCVLIALNPKRVVDTNTEAAVFSSVILDDRVAIIVNF
jgi:CHAT domain-containing protein